MKNDECVLFRISEAAKLTGVTRRMLLNYEDMELLVPARKDSASGYRYYSADNLMQIRLIRTLQQLGLSLAEVREYNCDTANIEAHIARLKDIRALLDKNIETLQVRAACRGDMTVRRTVLPAQVCFCRRYMCENTEDAAIKLRETYIAAARTGLLSLKSRMFTVRMGKDVSVLDILCCIPIDASYDGAERTEFPETECICIYYRGSYGRIREVIATLGDYARENRLTVAGKPRSIYLEGPPNRGTNEREYITQIALPVERP